MASPSAKPAMYGGSNASPARVIQSSRRSPSGPFRLRAGSGSHAGSWLRSLLPLPGEAFGGRFARVERDLRACLDRPEFPERERSEFLEPATQILEQLAFAGPTSGRERLVGHMTLRRL